MCRGVTVWCGGVWLCGAEACSRGVMWRCVFVEVWRCCVGRMVEVWRCVEVCRDAQRCVEVCRSV